MRENPKYRERDAAVRCAYKVADNLKNLAETLHPRYPKFLRHRLIEIYLDARSRSYPLTEHRNEVPRMIED